MPEEDKKPKKKKSTIQLLKARIKRLIADYDRTYSWGRRAWDKVHFLENKISLINEYFHKKTYKIEFKAQSQAKTICNFSRLVTDIHPQLAIDQIKTSTVDFELVNITKIA
jgi:hypothetical protein